MPCNQQNTIAYFRFKVFRVDADGSNPLDFNKEIVVRSRAEDLYSQVPEVFLRELGFSLNIHCYRFLWKQNRGADDYSEGYINYNNYKHWILKRI